MKLKMFFAAGLCAALLACKPSEPAKTPEAAVPTKPPVVTVNGKALGADLFEDYVKAITGKPSTELSGDDRNKIIENLVRIELIAQQSEKDGLLKEPEVASRLELARLNLIQQVAVQKYLKDRAPTEQELRAEYEEQVQKAPLVEYQARHILVGSEDIALKVVEQLKSGADFAALARRLSSDKESAKNGGELGWFAPNRMVPQFSQAVMLLKKGEYTKAPVHTQYGYHVIQLQNTRDRDPPGFDEVKEQLGQFVQNKKFLKYSDEMIKAAKIDPPLASAAAPAAPTAAAPAPAPAPAAN